MTEEEVRTIVREAQNQLLGGLLAIAICIVLIVIANVYGTAKHKELEKRVEQLEQKK